MPRASRAPRESDSSGGYDAYRTDLRFPDEASNNNNRKQLKGPRYSPFRRRLQEARTCL